MPENNESAFFVQGECNCKRCVEERKQAAASSCLKTLGKALPFVPANFDVKTGFNGLGFPGKDKLEELVNKLLKANEKTLAKFDKDGVAAKDRRYCADCGLLHVKVKANKVIRDSKTRYICPVCKEALYFECPNCKAAMRKTDGMNVEGVYYCVPCATELFKPCDGCGNFFKKRTLINMGQYGIRTWSHLCPKCLDDKTIECAECGQRIKKDDAIIRDGKMICNACEEKLKPIKSYGYKPKPIFAYSQAEKHREDKFYFGFELEVEFKRQANFNLEKYAEDLMAIAGRDRVYMKYDSSIDTSYGFEMVSYPMSWQKYREERKTIWDKIYEYMEAHKCHNDRGSCGFHIHMNKRSFTTMHIYKFIDFFYKTINNAFIIAMSNRGGYTSNFRQYANLKNDRFGDETLATKKWAKTKRGTDHHAAVDVSPAATYEIRVFGGAIKPELFHKNLEFTYALYLFTRDTSRLYNTVPHFVKWLLKRNNADQFRNLIAYIKTQKEMCIDYGIYDLIFKGAK